MIRALYDWTLRWAASPRAPVALGAVSFVESSVFPVPADVLFLPMCLARPDRAMRYALIATVTSVLGGVFGWAIGHWAFHALALPLLDFYGKTAAFEALKARTGTWAILTMLVTSGLSHIPPMKVVTILSGVVAFDLKLFILSAIVARGGRFYLLAFLLQRYGVKIAAFIETRLHWIALGVLAVLGLLFVLIEVL
ncbi:YqaA family protein [Paragemmobacter straminiformis]|uniref:DedA family protein n=1 Tax=Paragemmobacter straminiformis TaxID=2045119 RepID=A0A842I8N9_9RHOB|nr:YqaA family protein [Gemmobacter straminiformis]MBC2835358.1 DedA family protein [Gemmobacter straminiformis]